jgi:hypothetical protein
MTQDLSWEIEPGTSSPAARLMRPEGTTIDAEEPCEKAASATVRFEFKFHAQPERWSEEYTTAL